MTSKKFVMLGATVNPSDKETIERIADKNNLSVSYVTRMLLADSIKHLRERNVFKIISIIIIIIISQQFIV